MPANGANDEDGRRNCNSHFAKMCISIVDLGGFLCAPHTHTFIHRKFSLMCIEEFLAQKWVAWQKEETSAGEIKRRVFFPVILLLAGDAGKRFP
jgi:hypothetical protein